MKYPLTFYTNRFVPEGSAGCVRVFLIPLIFIRPEYREDVGILKHEQKHVAQAWRCVLPPLHGIMYLLDEDYRLNCEVEAYREQAKHYPDDRKPLFAQFISKDYGLNITQEKALELLNAP